ncbi:MAG: hypothetical protein LBR36_06090 [Bacteroidales bacterium]|jgi:hypothetical protein|nr:hypothetical protein [Bacteroidales bacterium]
MKKRQFIRIFTIFIIILLIFAIFVLTFKAYQFLKTPQTDFCEVLPKNTAFVLKSSNTLEITLLAERKSDLLNLLFDNKNTEKITSLLQKTNKVIDNQNFKKKSTLSIAWIATQKGYSPLMILQTDKMQNHYLERFWEYLQKDTQFIDFQYNNTQIYAKKTSQNNFFCYKKEGVLVFAFEEYVIRLSINNLNSKQKDFKSAFISLEKQDIKQHFSLFIQHSYFNPYIQSKILQTDGDDTFLAPLNCLTYSILSINRHANTIQASGRGKVAKKSFYSLFTHRKYKSDILQYIPMGAKNVCVLNAKNCEMLAQIKLQNNDREDFTKLLLPRQLAFFELPTDSNHYPYIALESENIEEAEFHLFQCIETQYIDNQYVIDTTCIGAYTIGKINLDNFIATDWGLFKKIPHLKFYTTIGNKIIFSTTKEAIILYINNIRKNRTLDKQPTFQNFDTYFTKNYNFLIYNNLLQNKKISKKHSLPIHSFRLQISSLSDSTVLCNYVVKMR